jgi:hypothetical protein
LGDTISTKTDEQGLTTRFLAQQSLYSGVTEQCAKISIKRAWRTTSLNVTQNRDSGILTQDIFQYIFDMIARYGVPFPIVGSLRNDHKCIPSTRLSPFVKESAHGIFPIFHIRWILGNQHPVSASSN